MITEFKNFYSEGYRSVLAILKLFILLENIQNIESFSEKQELNNRMDNSF